MSIVNSATGTSVIACTSEVGGGMGGWVLGVGSGFCWGTGGGL